jgi:hypothetical protein
MPTDPIMRHAVYRVRDGRPYGRAFAYMPTTAARRWVALHPAEAVQFVPALPDGPVADCGCPVDPFYDVADAWHLNTCPLHPDNQPATLGPCGCTDYHMADCPTRTGGQGMTEADAWAWAERHAADDGYGYDA